MPNITQETINRALLGDPAAAKVCTDAGYVLPCAYCGRESTIVEIPPHDHPFLKTINFDMPDHPGSWFIECACGAGMIDHNKQDLIARSNTRPDLRTVAKELYGVKWVACIDRLPPYDTPLMLRVKHGERLDVGYGILSHPLGSRPAQWYVTVQGWRCANLVLDHL